MKRDSLEKYDFVGLSEEIVPTIYSFVSNIEMIYSGNFNFFQKKKYINL